MSRCTLAAAALLLSAAVAAATPRESFQLANIVSNGQLNAPANAVVVRPLVGGYALGRVEVTGTLTSLNQYTWRTDSRVLITAPGGASVTLQPFLSGSTFSSLPVNASFYLQPGVDPAGAWTFRFYESFDDGGIALPDARWDVTFTFTDEQPPAPAAADLGVLAPPGVAITGAPISAGSVLWYRFTAGAAIRSAENSYLDADTNGSLLTPAAGGQFPDDTAIALYDAAGILVASDDDSGDGFSSQLTFGAGTRPPQGSSLPYDGRHGPLPPGTYYLAVAAHPADFGAFFWAATSTASHSGTINLTLGTNLGQACAPDCNDDLALNLADFGCFQTKFALGDPYADCNGDSLLNLADFGCFQTKFALGCP